MSNRELGHSTSKSIGDEKNTLKSIFRVVIGSQIVVPPTIPPLQWHSRDSNPWPWLWYHLSNYELCHSTSKPISDEKDTLKVRLGSVVAPVFWVFFFLSPARYALFIGHERWF